MRLAPRAPRALTAALLVLASGGVAHALEFNGTRACHDECFDWYVDLMAYRGWEETGNRRGDATLGNLTSGFENVPKYMQVGHILEREHNPLAAAFLPYARSFSLFDQMTELPTESNEPEDVEFELPDPSTIAYAGADDLLYMPIRQMAALIGARRVSCEEVVRFFIDRTVELDDLLALVTVPLFEEAIEMARRLDVEIAATGTRGPLTCIPIAVKDHHQIFDEPTTYGHLMFYNNRHTGNGRRSSLVHRLIDAGAIPFAKTVLTSFATLSSPSGWGVCLSPYLNGDGCGSSCGSGSGAAAGVFPFAVR